MPDARKSLSCASGTVARRDRSRAGDEYRHYEQSQKTTLPRRVGRTRFAFGYHASPPSCGHHTARTKTHIRLQGLSGDSPRMRCWERFHNTSRTKYVDKPYNSADQTVFLKVGPFC